MAANMSDAWQLLEEATVASPSVVSSCGRHLFNSVEPGRTKFDLGILSPVILIN